MKILYYYSKLNIGGAEKSTVRLLNAFTKNGHDVTLLLRWSGGTLESNLDNNVKIIHLKKNSNNKVKKLLENFKYYFRRKKRSVNNGTNRISNNVPNGWDDNGKRWWH